MGAAAIALSSDPVAASIFYDDVKLTKRQRQVFQKVEDEAPLPLVKDHGYLYNSTGEQGV